MKYSDEVLADSPKAYYRMQELSGLIQDSSGLGHHATSVIDGGLVYNPAGEPTGAINDEGNTCIGFTNSDFSIPDHADLDFGDTLSVEAWIFKSDIGVLRAISGRGSGALTWGTNTDNTLFTAKADVGIIVSSTIALSSVDTWYHVVYTKATTTSKIYVNGVDRTGTVTNQTLADVAVPLKVGGDYNDTLLWFGALDEVAFYSTALSATRVLEHYRAGLIPFSPRKNPRFVYIRKNK